MYNDDVSLIKQSDETTVDAIGQAESKEEKVTVLCQCSSVGRDEFYKAGQNGLRPTIILTVHPYEYEGQEEVEFLKKRYEVIKTYEKNNESLELTCQLKIKKV